MLACFIRLYFSVLNTAAATSRAAATARATTTASPLTKLNKYVCYVSVYALFTGTWKQWLSCSYLPFFWRR
jgi:hypothetical protein